MTVTFPRMTRDEVDDYLEREFPQIHQDGRIFLVEAIGDRTARMRMKAGPRHIRPGGTLSGPSMMTLADLVLYAAILGAIGPVGLAVTTNLSFNFFRKPEPRDLIADCKLLKVGKRLVVGEASLFSDGSSDVVCHAVGTYSVPAH